MFDLRVLLSLRLICRTLVPARVNVFRFGIQINMGLSFAFAYIACSLKKERLGDNTAAIMSLP